MFPQPGHDNAKQDVWADLGQVKIKGAGGFRLNAAAAVLGLGGRTIIRWRGKKSGCDMRKGPDSTPANKLDERERQRIVSVANGPEYRNKSPEQIAPDPADQGVCIGSESSFYHV